MIPFGDLKRQYFSLEKEIDKAVKKVNSRGWFILGEEGREFEKEFSEYCGEKYGIGVASGTDALIIVLKALGIWEGDEVITVPNTAIPTVSAIVSSGAKPVFVDIREDYLIDPGKIEKSITKKTKAIMPVHLYGQACDMEHILEIAGSYGLAVIEDCCQAHGTEYKKKKVPIGEIGCFSFYPSKNLGANGDGGMIITSDDKLEEKLRMLRDYGQKEKFKTEIHGMNSRLDEIQASILRIKLPYLDKWNKKRRKIAFFYNSELKNLVKIPDEYKRNNHIYHLYVIRTDKRDNLQKFLKEKEIGTAIHYPIPLHLQPAYSFLGYKEGDFPNAEKYAKEILSLPCFPELKNKEMGEIATSIKEFFHNN